MDKLEGVKIICYTNYWDGPLCGICEYQGKLYRFDCKELGGWSADTEEPVDRKWFVREIELWQLAYELYWHCLFETECGQYFDKSIGHTESLPFVNERYKLPDVEISDKRYQFLEAGEAFYQKQEKEYNEIDYSQNKIIGWFE